MEGLSCHSGPSTPEVAAAGVANVRMDQLESLVLNNPLLSLLYSEREPSPPRDPAAEAVAQAAA